MKKVKKYEKSKKCVACLGEGKTQNHSKLSPICTRKNHKLREFGVLGPRCVELSELFSALLFSVPVVLNFLNCLARYCSRSPLCQTF